MPTWRKTGRRPGLFACLLSDRAGNIIALVAAALFPLLALLGSSLDMGRIYLVQSRLQQVCDAGTLAARNQMAGMPNFNSSSGSDQVTVTDRGKMPFNSNVPTGTYGARNLAYNVAINPDLSIKATANLVEPTTIMAIFGLNSVPMSVTCTAQMTVTSTDIMMVLDVTGSLTETLFGDSQSRISAVRQVVKGFWTQTSTNQAPGKRIRFGFVPYSTNVNVGGLLKDEWVVPSWTYQSRTLDLSYGSYGAEPIDQRRWSESSPLTPTQTIEKRFTYACKSLKNKNITVWFIAFGTALNPIMTDCAGPGHSVSASNSTELAAAFAQISKGASNLRMSG